MLNLQQFCGSFIVIEGYRYDHQQEERITINYCGFKHDNLTNQNYISPPNINFNIGEYEQLQGNHPQQAAEITRPKFPNSNFFVV
jgi:hypothetical protein